METELENIVRVTVRTLELIVYSALVVVAFLQFRRRGDRAALWFGFTALSLALVLVISSFFLDPQTPRVGSDLWLAKAQLAILALFPYLLYRFMVQFTTTPRWLRQATAALTLGIVAWTVLLSEIPITGAERSPAFQAYLIAFLVHWTVMSVVVATFFWRAGSGAPGVARRRMRLLSVASIGLTLVLLISASTTTPAVRIAFQLVGLAATIAFYLGFSPPEALRVLWRRDEQEALQKATSALVQARTRDEVTKHLLPHVSRTVGGAGAALLDKDGEVLGLHRASPDEVKRHIHHLRSSEFDPSSMIAREGAVFLPQPFGWLIVLVGPMTPFFGSSELRLLEGIATLTTLALERVEVFEREIEANNRLRELDQLKNEFVAMVAHDLRSPMTVIAGFADTVQMRWDTLEESQKLEFLGLISRNTRSLAAFVEDVLQVARIESGQFSYDFRPFDPRALVERTVNEIASTHENAHIDVSVPDDVPMALGDEERNWQILTNLLSNAIKFSPENASVDVSVQPNGKDMVRFAVRDRGIGIKPEDMSKLFRKFSRISQPVGQRVKGTGLGLYICKSMIEAHGGRIWVESRPGEGSTFSYTLPVAKTQEQEHQLS